MLLQGPILFYTLKIFLAVCLQYTKTDAQLTSTEVGRPMPQTTQALRVKDTIFAWSSWGSWSPCSRTCGGGVAVQERQCLPRDPTRSRRSRKRRKLSRSTERARQQREVSVVHGPDPDCPGLARRYHECNTAPCPGPPRDSRAEQCAVYDRRPFRGRFYTWVPYVDGNAPCTLNCRPRGQQFYASLALAADGTPCTKPGFRAICVQGTCKHITHEDSISPSSTDVLCINSLPILTDSTILAGLELSNTENEEFPNLNTNLLKDFKILYPDTDNKLKNNWNLIKPKIIDHAKKKSDEVLKDLLRNCNEDDENSTDLGAFMALPYLMNTNNIVKSKKGKGQQWRPSKQEVLDAFITHVKTAAEIDECITRRREKLKKIGLTLQPFIIVVGPSPKEIFDRYVILNNVRYEVTTILEAVDACFKIIFVLNAEYPPESKHVWQFIQKALFNLDIKYDKVYMTVNTLIMDLNIQ